MSESQLPVLPNSDVERIASFYEIVSGKHDRKFHRSKVYRDAAIISDDTVRRILKQFDDALLLDAHVRSISCAVYDADGVLTRYNDIEAMLEKSGDAEPPKYCEIEITTIEFTEKIFFGIRTLKLTINSFYPSKVREEIENPIAGSLKISSSGTDQIWVDSIFRRSCSVLGTSVYGGYLNFVRKVYNGVKSDTYDRLLPLFALLAVMLMTPFVSDWMVGSKRTAIREEALLQITSASDILEKFDAFAQYDLRDASKDMNIVLFFSTLAVAAVLLLAFFSYLIPKFFELLSPKTYLAFGESRTLCERRLANHRSVANAVIISGLAFPLLWLVVAVFIK